MKYTSVKAQCWGNVGPASRKCQGLLLSMKWIVLCEMTLFENIGLPFKANASLECKGFLMMRYI